MKKRNKAECLISSYRAKIFKNLLTIIYKCDIIITEREVNKMKKFYCPIEDWSCPYFKLNGSCGMVDEGFNPEVECDDAWSCVVNNWVEEDDD